MQGALRPTPLANPPSAPCPGIRGALRAGSLPLFRAPVPSARGTQAAGAAGPSLGAEPIQHGLHVATQQRKQDAEPRTCGLAARALVARGARSAASVWRALLRLRAGLGGEACLAAAAVGAPRSMVGDAMGSTVLVCCFWGWFTAQFLKIFYYKYKRGVWTLKAMVASGGMPSSHSAMCTATTTAVGLTEGFGSPLFAIAICFSCIVMYDAAGVRRHAGYQAEVLNKVVKEIMAGHPLQDRELKEVLGHTPIQVLCGGLLGVIIAVAGINHLGF